MLRSVALVGQILRGKSWRPLSVEFAHDPIDQVVRYAEIVDAPVKFGAADNGIVFRREAFDRRSFEYNAEILAFVVADRLLLIRLTGKAALGG